MSQGQLAERIGIIPQALSRRLTGRTVFNIDELDAIARALNLPVVELVTIAVAAAKGSAA